eukprot:CAMPEP_0170503620 /NCGR_PEP_ID=MMETSP0208-20121228/45377_1 /TAXON_ID=197538 /ORGANISM="Strombidium inclinatum, Strain S3" /LENGTH=133 /DNA_ID=CAMNT_0010783371 /DNA_START=158 /DNA_END=559 /DNA_ORIENTATION=-
MCLTPTTEMIANLVEIENAHINVEHPDFIGAAGGMLDMFEPEPEGKKNYTLVDSKALPLEEKKDSFDADDLYEEEETKDTKDDKGYFERDYSGKKEAMSEMGDLKEEDRLKMVKDSFDSVSTKLEANAKSRKA